MHIYIIIYIYTFCVLIIGRSHPPLVVSTGSATWWPGPRHATNDCLYNHHFHFHPCMPTRANRSISFGIVQRSKNEYSDTKQLRRSQGQGWQTSTQSYYFVRIIRDVHGSWHVSVVSSHMLAEILLHCRNTAHTLAEIPQRSHFCNQNSK